MMECMKEYKQENETMDAERLIRWDATEVREEEANFRHHHL